MRFLGVLFLAMLAFSGESFAQSEVRIGTVDLQRAVTASTEGAKDRSELLKKKDQLNEELKTLLSDLEKQRAELEKGRDKIPAEEHAEKERLFQKNARDYQNRQREAQEELKQLESGYLKKLLAKFGAILTKIGDEEKYSVILDKNTGVFYAGAKTDVTSTLVKRADEEFQGR
jgi:outer membrane protein